MPYAPINNMTMYYEEAGAGPPLVLLHGAGAALDVPEGSWASLIKLLSRHFRTISIEHRGHGRTDNPDETFDYATIAEDVAVLAAKLSLDKFAIGGISDGAIAGMHLGMHHPNLVAALVLIGVNYCNDEQTKRANAQWSHFADEPEDSPLAQHLSQVHDRSGKPAGYWRSLFRGLIANVAVSPNYTVADLQRVIAPTLLLAGENDDYANSDQLATLRHALTNTEVAVIDHAGHSVQYSHPHLVGPTVVDFLLRHWEN